MALSKDLSKPIAGREVCLYQFSDFYLAPVKRVLWRGIDPVPMTPKFEVRELQDEGSSVVVEEHIRTHIVAEEMEDVGFADED